MIASAHVEEAPLLGELFSVEREYARCVVGLERAGILMALPKSERMGVVGVDGEEYPVPTREEVVELFARNGELVGVKLGQGFDRLEFTPMAMSVAGLIERMEAAIVRHGAERRIYQTRRSPDDALVPVRVNREKHVWVWETLREALDGEKLAYFPQEYSSEHGGLTKVEASHDGRICGVAGWSVGLVESTPVMPRQGEGKTLGGRRQLEIGSSPREYLGTLKMEAYRGETGRTVEDFITRFVTHLETADEVSNDVDDGNALWCLGQYMKIAYAEVVPTGRWHRKIGRVRLDMHRTGNKQCARSWGGATTVRLARA